jgi:hypothetical protein
VINQNERSGKSRAKQGAAEDTQKPIRINGSTHFDFEGRNLTAYGGLLPVATMLEKLRFQQLLEEMLTVNRATRVMPLYQFLLAMVLALYVGFSRLHHLRFGAAIFQSRGPNMAFAYADRGSALPSNQRLMNRLRSITDNANGFVPVISTPLCC